MGWRFRRSVRLIPGVRINFSKSGVSTSIGGRGAWLTVGRRGTRATVGIPGTGISYTSFSASKTGHARAPYVIRTPPQPAAPGDPRDVGIGCLAKLIVLALGAWLLWHLLSHPRGDGTRPVHVLI